MIAILAYILVFTIVREMVNNSPRGVQDDQGFHYDRDDCEKLG